MAIHTLKITVIDGGRGSAESTKESKIISNQPTALEQAQGTTKDMLQAINLVSRYADIPMQAAKAAINYKLSGIVYETGDSDYAAHIQQKYDNVTGLAKIGGSVIMSGLTGFAYGGPVGAAAAVATSVASIGINEALNMAEYRREYTFNRQSDVFRVDQTKLRSGITTNGGGRER